jgi:hypothetical protein
VNGGLDFSLERTNEYTVLAAANTRWRGPIEWPAGGESAWCAAALHGRVVTRKSNPKVSRFWQSGAIACIMFRASATTTRALASRS